MSAKTVSRRQAASTIPPAAPLDPLHELEAAILKAHDTYGPADTRVDYHLGLALVHVRKALGEHARLAILGKATS
jgi:hypothetical protein